MKMAENISSTQLENPRHTEVSTEESQLTDKNWVRTIRQIAEDDQWTSSIRDHLKAEGYEIDGLLDERIMDMAKIICTGNIEMWEFYLKTRRIVRKESPVQT